MRDDLKAGAVELLRQQFFRDRQAYGVGDALPQGPGGRLRPGSQAIFRMPRSV